MHPSKINPLRHSALQYIVLMYQLRIENFTQKLSNAWGRFLLNYKSTKGSQQIKDFYRKML